MVREAVERCQALPFESVRAEQADATALPFEDGSFDAVIAMHMLYHVPDPAKAIAEMHRVLKPDGFLAVTTNGTGNMRRMYELATVFGSPPPIRPRPAFGYDAAERLMRLTIRQRRLVAASGAPSGNRAGGCVPGAHVLSARRRGPGGRARPAPPGDRRGISEGNGVLEVEKESGLFISRRSSG